MIIQIFSFGIYTTVGIALYTDVLGVIYYISKEIRISKYGKSIQDIAIADKSEEQIRVSILDGDRFSGSKWDVIALKNAKIERYQGEAYLSVPENATIWVKQTTIKINPMRTNANRFFL